MEPVSSIATASATASLPGPAVLPTSRDVLRAGAGSGREVQDQRILPRVDEVAFVAREAQLPLDFWARLALDNARQPAAQPVPYWARLAHHNRVNDEVRRAALPADPGARHRPSESSRAATAREGSAPTSDLTNGSRPSYGGPTLAAPGARTPNPATRTQVVTQYQRIVYAPTGRLIDMLI